MQEDNELLQLLRHNGVEITQLAAWEEESYLPKWFNRVVPKSKRKEAMELHCFGGYELMGDYAVYSWGYLWHVFCSDLLGSQKAEKARRELDSTPKKEAILLDYLNRDAYWLNKLSGLKAEHLELGDDILLTDIDFKWTYAKTHEPDLGPYFHYIHAL